MFAYKVTYENQQGKLYISYTSALHLPIVL